MERPKFFTWVEEKFDEPAQVPVRLRSYLRTLWLEGSTVEVLALATNLPEEWVELFVKDNSGETKPH